MDPLPHALVVAPLFPAVDGATPAAAMRSRGLVLALGSLGYRVTVVCGMPYGRRAADAPGIDVHSTPWLDYDGLVRRVGATVGRQAVGDGKTAGRALISRVVPPDRYLTWVPGAAIAARRLLHPGSIILSTSAKSAHLVGHLVARGRPWIADLNDPWVHNPHMPAGPIRAKVDRRLEALGIGAATHITTVTPPLRDALATRFGDERVTTLMSGFDPLESRHFGASATVERGLLLYVGTLYDRLDLTPLFSGVAEARRLGTLSANGVRFRFVGRLNERVMREAAAHGVEEFFEVSGPVARSEVLAMMAAADALILPVYDGDPYSLPMKFFEYLGAGRPIVALGPPDRLGARMVVENDLGTVVSSSHGARDLVEQLSQSPEPLAPIAPETVAPFTWSATTDVLHGILRQIRHVS